MQTFKITLAGLSFLGYACLLSFAAQEHGAAPVQNQHGQPPQRMVAYPDRPKAAKDVLERGQAIYGANCAFCHGSDAGGGTTGPNLLRSNLVLGDENGELIIPIVHGSRVDKGMPRIQIDEAQIRDASAWLHSLKVTSHSSGDDKIDIVVGDASTGRVVFENLCAQCHSVTGDLKGIATRLPDPKTLQQTWLMPAPSRGEPAAGVKTPPVTATVTMPDGSKVDGRLERIDDFYVGLIQPDGTLRTFVLDNGVPVVELHDPLEAHRDMLRGYTDKSIHDITAYLVTIR